MIRTPESVWTALGTEFAAGITVEGFTCTVNDAGPDSCGFTLRRRPAVPWPDLLAFNQCEVWVGGVPVWGGRIWEAPLSDGGENVIGVQGRGWQYHLDDDLLNSWWVQTDMTGWGNLRDVVTTDLAQVGSLPTVTVGAGLMSLGWASGVSVPANTNGDRCGFFFDAGPGRVVKRVALTYSATGPSSSLQAYFLESNVKPFDVTTATLVTTMGAASSGTLGRTLPTACRYIAVMGQNGTGAPIAIGSEAYFQVTAVKLFVASAYESGGASILKASDVVRDVLSSGALPLLDTSTAAIASTSFSIPDFAPDGYQSPRAILAAANAYESKLLGVDAQRRLFYRTRPVDPVLEVGAWPGSSFQDSSTNSAEGLYNRVLVQGTGPDGLPISELRTLSSSLLTRQGFTRTTVLSVSAAMTTASAQQLGDIYLSEKAAPPLKGTITVQGHGAARTVVGGPVHPAALLMRAGERIRLGHLVDPTTGGWGRDGTIKSVTYTHDSDTASVELDNERGRFEALLERLGIVTSLALR